MSALWAIYVPGPDEYYAMPSERVAREMAVRHNTAMAGSVGVAGMMESLGLSVEQVSAFAVVWPYSAEDHADDLLAHCPAGWPA